MNTFEKTTTNGVVLKKMDYSDMPEILHNLKMDWPHAIHTYYFLLNFMNWTKQNWNGDFNFYCPKTKGRIGSVMAVAKFKDGYTFVNYHCIDNLSCKEIQDGIRHSHVLNWSELLIFEAIHDRIVPGLKEIIEAKALKVVKNESCYQVWLPPEKAKDVSVAFPPVLKFQPLDVNLTKLINSNWGYSGVGTEVIVKDSLYFNGGLGIRLGNRSLIGWSVEQHYGGMGMLFVYPEHRRLGYAVALVNMMVRRAVVRGIDPFAIIEVSNKQSRKLFQKLSFENVAIVHWIGVKK